MTVVAVGSGVGFNIADVAVDQHVRAGHGGDVAIRWIGRDRADLDDPLDIDYSMLARRSSRFAGALRRHGATAGTVVSTVLGRVPDLYVAALGTWKAGGVFVALPDSSEARSTADRLRLGRVGVAITSPTSPSSPTTTRRSGAATCASPRTTVVAGRCRRAGGPASGSRRFAVAACCDHRKRTSPATTPPAPW